MIGHYNGEFQEIRALYQAAVFETASQHYKIEQCAVWAHPAKNDDYWKWRCELKRPFLYRKQNLIAGFAELDQDGHIDCLYTAPEFNRQGIGSALVEHIITIAEQTSLTRLFVEASHCARGLFARHQFQVVRPNVVTIDGVELQNWIMERSI